MRQSWLGFGLGALSLILPAFATAQSNLLFDIAGQSVTATGIPFQGKLVGHQIGRSIHAGTVSEDAEDIRGQIRRDSMGRVRIEYQQGDKVVSVEVFDPVSGTELKWNGDSTIATLTRPLSGVPWHLIFSSQLFLDAQEVETERRQPGKVTKDDIGKKSVNGFVAEGTRTTTVVATGKIVHEVWFSQDLNLAVLDVFTDAKGVEQRIEIEEVTRIEPDPTLFQMPPGYSVKPMALPGQMGGGGLVGGRSSASPASGQGDTTQPSGPR